MRASANAAANSLSVSQPRCSTQARWIHADTPPPTEAVIPAQAAGDVRAEKLIGMTVYDTNGDKVGAVKDKYKVKGLPTVVIYDSTGAEKKRWTEFVGADDFLTALEGIN